MPHEATVELQIVSWDSWQRCQEIHLTGSFNVRAIVVYQVHFSTVHRDVTFGPQMKSTAKIWLFCSRISRRCGTRHLSTGPAFDSHTYVVLTRSRLSHTAVRCC